MKLTPEQEIGLKKDLETIDDQMNQLENLREKIIYILRQSALDKGEKE